VISGPAGVGKTTVIEWLLGRPGYSRSITATTRAPRAGERDGVDYLFLSRPDFERGAAAGRFLERAEVHGNFYGTPRDGVEAVLARGEVCLLNIDVQGAASFRGSGLPLVTVFLLPPSMEELERRLRVRATERAPELSRRLEVARRELAQADRFDLKIVNVVVEDAVREIGDFIESRRRR